jgi:DNA repair protein RecN (Recombination protein N)
MLEELRISSLGVIESSTLEFGPGLTCITGETGAGKTMIVTALGLLLGGRGDAGAVRAGARSARIEGVLRVGPETRASVDGLGGEVEDDHLLLARTVSAEGRSRGFAGGASVPVSQLAGLTEPLVAIHGQSDQHRLLQAPAQRAALDASLGADHRADLEAYDAAYQRLHEVEAELAEVSASARERAREADLLRFGLSEVEAVSPQPGEDDDLAAEESRLGHADALRLAAEGAREALSSDQDSPDALGAVAAARTSLEGVRDHDPTAAQLADRLAEVSYLVSDLAADVAAYASGLDSDPARLATVSQRRADLGGLIRKYGETIDEVLAWSESAATRLLELDGTDDTLAGLRAESEELRAALADLAGRISERRTAGADALGARVTDELTTLAMPHARIEIAVRQSEIEPEDPRRPLSVGRRWLRFGRGGVDEVEFLLAANTGSEPRPLAKGASGGELSRVMLALEVVLAGHGSVPTMVFDEVDAGVGGAAAVEVGRRLAALAKTTQVLVVTHLPQVAAFADQHVVVEKSTDGSITSSGLTVLDDAARERELSRMMAGLEQSDTALAHARELLEAARDGRGAP